MAKYDIYNPTRARRVIFDGLTNRRVEILPGQTVEGVPLADSVVERLRGYTGDLQVTEVQDGDPVPPPPVLKASVEPGKVSVVKPSRKVVS